MHASFDTTALRRVRPRRIAFLASVLVLSACSRAAQSPDVSAACVFSPVRVDAWSTLVSPINGVAMSYPPAYVEKRWTNRGSNDPSPSATAQRELWSLAELWVDDHPANSISFGMARPTGSRYGDAPSGPVRACDVRSRVGVWHVWLSKVGGPLSGASAGFIVIAKLVVPGDSMLLHFRGFATDTLERERQLAVLGTFRPIPR